MHIDIKEFFCFSEETFHIGRQIERLPDKRKRRQIRLKQILQMFLAMGALGIRSIRQIDFIGRQKWAKALTRCNRLLVASDSAIQRVLVWLSGTAIREINWRCYSIPAVQNNLGIHLLSGKKVRVGVIDASGFGKILASTFCVLGKDMNWFLDSELMKKRGKELPSSFKLLERLADKFGENFVDYVVTDGLYSCRRYFMLCKKIKICGIVKTSEKGLNILEDAEGIFNQSPLDALVEHVTGVDETRNCEYELWRDNNFWMEGVDTSLTVVRVKETPFKGKNAGKPEIFWIISQTNDLSAYDLRELAHSRWRIENNGFKSFNDQCLSKNLFTHNAKARFTLLRIQLLTFNIIQCYRKISTDKICNTINGFVFFPAFVELRQIFWQSLERVFCPDG